MFARVYRPLAFLRQITKRPSTMRLHQRRRSPPVLLPYLKITQFVLMQPRQVQHELEPKSKCLRLNWGRFSPCCLRLLAPSISVVSLARYHWETTFFCSLKSVLHPSIKRWERKERGKREMQESTPRVDAAYERACWESPARMPHVCLGGCAFGCNTLPRF